VRDLPLSDQPVELKLQVRRFRCLNEHCERRTFAERILDMVPIRGRRTGRLACVQQGIGLAVGGEAGARLVKQLRMPVSPDTLLREVRQARIPARSTPRVLGVDDWAWRKGQRYGTILVDLERHEVVDLLPDRTADSLSQWLQAHPGVEVISRDRSGTYVDGASRGVPDAVQVADRFHLLGNLRVALEEVATRLQAAIRAASVPASSADTPDMTGAEKPQPTVRPSSSLPPAGRRLRVQQQMVANRDRRLARYEQVVKLHQQGVSQKAIATQLDLCPKTIRRWLRAGQFPERAARRKRVTRLDGYQSYLRQRWQEGCHNGARLWRELREQGYAGSRTLVADWVAGQRLTDGAQPTECQRAYSPRRVSWLFMRDRDELEANEQEFLDRLLLASPIMASAYQLARDFCQMVKGRQAQSPDGWLKKVADSELEELQRFAAGLQRDYAAVMASLSLVWSNGQVEGQINRLKILKRQMYGRAGFDLLRQRVLLPT
jgi:transposase